MKKKVLITGTLLVSICGTNVFAFAQETETVTEAVMESETDEKNSAAAEFVEMPEMGLRYLYTQEMKEAGIVILDDGGISTLQEYSFMEIQCENLVLGGILVVPEELYLNAEGGPNLYEVYQESYSDCDVWETMEHEYHYIFLDLHANINPDMLTSELAAAYETAVPYVQEMLKNIEYIDLVPKDFSDERLTFDTLNLDGEQVTDAILGEKDYTVINVWATYCNPCINEMPQLAAWEQELPDNVQILYVCSDIRDKDASEIELADMVADRSGISRDHVLLWLNESFSQLKGLISAVPTTLIVDKEGILTDKIIVGSYVEGYKEALADLLAR